MHSIIISQKLLTDDDAVHRNASIRYYKIKLIPPVSLLQTQLTMRVISARSFGSLTEMTEMSGLELNPPSREGYGPIGSCSIMTSSDTVISR